MNIGQAEHEAWLEHPLTKALKRSFEQSVTDPENQPSQYGTVTLEMYEALEAEITTLKVALREAKSLLIRYRNETPLGHQPHMISHIAEEAIATIVAVLGEEK